MDEIGRYQLLRLLGRGSFCAVYDALDRTTGERIALKQLRRTGHVSFSNFKREFRAVQGLHHPNLVELRELFELDGAGFIAMELVEGVDLVSYVRNGRSASGFDPSRLHDAFRQLSQALVALHAAGVVHRDLKPRNVLVTTKGRVVLLDFGLVKTLDQAPASGADYAVGSVPYMAPEQVDGTDVGPPADFYALGACLYEALTGETPFAGVAGSPFELMAIKQRQSLPPLAANASGVPHELATLCTALLEREPSKRPLGPEVIAAFDVGAASIGSAVAAESFSGREHELELLMSAFSRSCKGGFELILVEGESGIGKSALVAEFLRRLQQQIPDALVLRSRCYENDLLAYKAFDGGMEQLAQYLTQLDRVACQALLPSHAVLLSRLFAAFGSVEGIAAASVEDLPADSAAQRLLGFGAVSWLLARIAQQRPLVVAVDDLHWADAESFRLLRAIAEDPGRPAALVVATVRPKSDLTESATASLALLKGWSCTQTALVDGLSSADAKALAVQLLGARASETLLDVVLSESRGHPMLLSELVRYAEARGWAQSAHMTLDAVLRERIEALSPEAQQLISLAALAARPYHAQVFASATGTALADVSLLATELLAAKLLRRRHGHEIACFHDRIRHVAQQRLDPEHARRLHAQLAGALATQPAPDPAELARHYDAAGDTNAAIAAYARAGEQALSTLASARAEELWRRALTLAADTPISARVLSALQVGHGHALARSGRSAEAAHRYLEAAPHAEGEDQTRLRIWAAQHLLQSARVEEGMAAARALLSELDVPLPASTGAALKRLKWDRFWLSLRGLETNRATGPASVLARTQLDALWGMAMPVAWIDPLTGSVLSTRHLRLARKVADPRHLVRALAEGANARAIQNPDDPEAAAQLARARVLFDAGSDPALEVLVSFGEGRVASWRWELLVARERMEHAHRVATQRCPDQPWLLNNVRASLGPNLLALGEHALLAKSSAGWLIEARDRNDQFALTMLDGLGYGCIRYLMADEVEPARAALAASMAPWPSEPFSFAHYGELLATSHIELYGGGDGAERWFESELPRLSRAFLLQKGLGKISLLIYRGYASLAAHNVSSAERARPLLDEARAATRLVKRSSLKYAAIHALLLEAQLAAYDADLASALDKARQLRTLSSACAYIFVARTAEYFEGLLEGGDAGKHKREAALAFFAAQGWKKPKRAVALLCPAIDWLEARP